MSHSGFRNLLHDVKTKLINLVSTPSIETRGSAIRIGIRCKKGRHRSVACMAVLSAILEEWQTPHNFPNLVNLVLLCQKRCKMHRSVFHSKSCNAFPSKTPFLTDILEEWQQLGGLRIGHMTPHTEKCGCPDACTNLQRPIKRLKSAVEAVGREEIATEWLDDGLAAIAYAKRLWLHM